MTISARKFDTASVVKKLNCCPKSLYELATEIGCDPGTVRRILSTLEDIGYVKKENSKYHLTASGNSYLETLPPDYKLCKKCGLEKSVSEFSVDNTKSDKLQSYCKDCNSIYMKEYNDRKHKLQSNECHKIEYVNTEYLIPVGEFTSKDFREINSESLVGRDRNTPLNILYKLLREGKIELVKTITDDSNRIKIYKWCDEKDTTHQIELRDIQPNTYQQNIPPHISIEELKEQSTNILLNCIDENINRILTSIGSEEHINTFCADTDIPKSLIGIVSDMCSNICESSSNSNEIRDYLYSIYHLQQEDSARINKCLAELIALQKKQYLLFEQLASKGNGNVV